LGSLESRTYPLGSKVKIHYTGKYEDGTVFDSSREREPLEFTIGDESTILGFEEAVTGMSAGETKDITLAPEKAFGEYHEEMVQKVERKDLPEDVELEVGIVLEVTAPEGQTYMVRVTELDDESVTLDGNHPLAGETLSFDIELVEVG